MTAQKISPRTIALCAVLAALALIFSYIEALLPLSGQIPGVKLGIANLVILIVLYTLGFPYALFINVVRILTAGLLFNGLFGALYSLSGALLSLGGMYLLKKAGCFSVIGVSMAGGVLHNTGQLLIAALLVSNVKMFYYFPVLLWSGLASGILIGLITYWILKKLPSSLFRI